MHCNGLKNTRSNANTRDVFERNSIEYSFLYTYVNAIDFLHVYKIHSKPSMQKRTQEAKTKKKSYRKKNRPINRPFFFPDEIFFAWFCVYRQCRTVFRTDCYKKLHDGNHKLPPLFFARCDVKNHKAETAKIAYVSNNNSLVRCKINLH